MIIKTINRRVVTSLIFLISAISITQNVWAGRNDSTVSVTISNYTNYPIEFGLRNWGMPNGNTITGMSNIKINSSSTLPSDDAVTIPPMTGLSNPGILSITANVEYNDAIRDNAAGYAKNGLTCYNSALGNALTEADIDFSNQCDLPGYDVKSLDDTTHASPRFDLIFASGGTFVTFIYSTASISGSTGDTGTLLFSQRHNTLISPDGQKTLLVCLTSANDSVNNVTSTTDEALGIFYQNSQPFVNPMGPYERAVATVWNTLNFTITTADQNTCTNSDQFFSLLPSANPVQQTTPYTFVIQ